MATFKQRAVAEQVKLALGSGVVPSKGEMLQKAGYKRGTVVNPKEVFESKGLKQELAKLGFNEENAKAVIGSILNAPLSKEIVGPADQLRAADMVLKAFGSYKQNESSQNIHINFVKFGDNDRGVNGKTSIGQWPKNNS